jgi:raffinose/stachyose/melibiose transport system permease protein
MKIPFKKKIFPLIIMLFFSFIIGVPLVYAVKESIGGDGVSNYVTALIDTGIWRNFINSCIVNVLSISFIIFSSIFAAFAFSKLHFRLKRLLFIFILSGLMLPAATIVFPVFKVVSFLGLHGSYFSLIGPYAGLFLPFILLIVKNYIDDLPDDLIEAALIDGAPYRRILSSIIAPMAVPAISTGVVWIFLATWNEFFYAFIFLQRKEMKTLTVLPAQFMSQYSSNIHLAFAIIILIEIPVIIVFMFLRKYIRSGMTAGAVKG